MKPIIARPATRDDYPAILALNDAAVPAVNRISIETLAHLHAESCYLGLVCAGSDIIGFLLALDETADYASSNFRFFRDRFDRFVYIDRIVVSPTRQRTGLGTDLYTDLLARFEHATSRLACEVNVEPPNPQSMAFHEHLGFTAVGEQRTENGQKKVRLMVKSLT